MKAAIAIGTLLLAFVVYRPIAKWAITPSDTRAAWVEPIATFGTGLHGQVELPPFDRQPPVYGEMYSAIAIKANEQKRRLWTTYTSGSGRYGLFHRYSTVEGAWIYQWLLAEDGRLRFIRDTTRDGGAPATAVHSYVPTKAGIGFLRDGTFIEGEPGPEDSPILVIQMDIGRYDPARFY